MSLAIKDPELFGVTESSVTLSVSVAIERTLVHSTRCRDFFKGGYRDFALGSLANRCDVRGS